MKPKVTLTQERVRELFDYDPDTGIVTRKFRIGAIGRGKAGDIVGYKHNVGYLGVKIEDKGYLLHRVIWMILYGYFPEHQIDHINRVRTDNRQCNLREVSPVCNNRNAGVYSSSTTGVKGVYWHKHNSGYVANITANVDDSTRSRQLFLGIFKDFTEAVAHRLAAEQSIGWEGCDSDSSAYRYMQKYIKGECNV